MRYAVLGCAIMAFGMLTAHAAGQNAPANGSPGAQQGPKPTTSQFGDWIMICRQGNGPNANQESCELTQTFTIQGQSAPFAQIAVGRISPKDPFNVTVVVPHNVSFPSDVNIATDEKNSNPLTLHWTRCLATGCFASTELKEATMKTWRGLSQKGRIVFKNALGQDVVLPLSFNGAGAAMDALMKKS